MIPLSYFLFAWLALMLVYGMLALITFFTFLRYSLSNLTTYASLALFLLGIVVVFAITGSVLAGIDWSQTLNFAAAAPLFHV